MPEHLRALVVIFTLAGATFLVMQRPAVMLGMALDDFKRRRNLWLAITVVAFTGHFFWVFAVLAGVMVAAAGRKDPHPLALYLFLLFVIPPFGESISGFGLVNQLLQITYPRLLSLVVLLPCFLSLRVRPDTLRFGRHLADWFLLAYLVLRFILQQSADTFTNTLRNSLYDFLDVFLPYYVASRSLRSVDDFRQTMLAFAAGAAVLAPIAVFEFVKHWLLYNSLPYALGTQWQAGDYLMRGESVRAVATTGQSIVLGFVMMVALLLHGSLRWVNSRSWGWLLGLVALGGGAIAPLARGPWVGLAVGIVVIAATGPRPVVRLAKLGLLGLVVGTVVVLSPVGDSVIDHLPFIGSIDNSNVVYRQRLFDASMTVLAQSPLFGAPDYMFAPVMQELSVGGLIDIVNTYIAVALSCGYVGLALFAGVFASAIWSVFFALRVQADQEGERYLQGRVLLGTLIAIVVTIATVSSISFIPIIYWCICGLAIAYARAVRAQEREASTSPSLYVMGAS